VKVVQGEVVALETGKPVAGLLVALFARNDNGGAVRVGSVATDNNGRFRMELSGDKWIWDLTLEVTATAPETKLLYRDDKPREHAGDLETWMLRLPVTALT
jgi:hypothetical protein